MKCANCGAELKTGCIYCSVCGHEAQIVPDYNILEDDYLKTLLEEENRASQAAASRRTQSESPKAPAKKTKKRRYWFPIILAVVVIGIIAAVTITTVIHNQREDSFDYQYTQGMLAKKDKDFKNAVSYLQRALELDNSNTSIMMELATIYQQQQDTDAEEEMLLQLLLLESENEDAYEMLIELYDSKEQYDKIVELYEKLKDTPLKKLFYEYVVVTPEFSKSEGTYSEEGEVELSAQTGCTIYYAFGNTDPKTEGKIYQEAIPLSEGETVIQAVAKDERGIYSDVVTAKYEIEFQAPKEPTVTPASGSYSTPQMIAVNVPENSVVYYTWDGTTPTEASTRYEGPFEMPQGNNVLALVAVDNHGLSSSIIKINYIYLPE